MIRIIDSYTVRVLVACGMFEISRTNSGFMKLNDSETLRLAPDGPLEAWFGPNSIDVTLSCSCSRGRLEVHREH